MSLINNIDPNKIPEHVAIIMDGNGRWAKQRNLSRSEGHRKGVESVRTAMRAASKLNIKYLTLYTFSTENWNRSQEEVDALMDLMIYAIGKETEELIANDIRLKVIGDIDRLPKKTHDALMSCLAATADCKTSTIILALSYSSRWEITNATKKIAKAIRENKLKEEDINEETISNHLETRGIADPDLLIRTGGECRISNFLLWQISYAELYFTDVLWPDFGEESFFEAIINFQQKERRFGKTSEQLK